MAIYTTYSKIATRTKAYLHTLANKILEDHPDVLVYKIGNWSKQDTLSHSDNNLKNKRIDRAVQNNTLLKSSSGT